MEKFFALLLTTTVLLGLSACSDRPDAQVEQFPPTVYDGTGDVTAGAADRPGLPPGISIHPGCGWAGQRERPRVRAGRFNQETRIPGCSEPPPLRRKTRCAHRRRAAKGLSARKGPRMPFPFKIL